MQCKAAVNLRITSGRCRTQAASIVSETIQNNWPNVHVNNMYYILYLLTFFSLFNMRIVILCEIALRFAHRFALAGGIVNRVYSLCKIRFTHNAVQQIYTIDFTQSIQSVFNIILTSKNMWLPKIFVIHLLDFNRHVLQVNVVSDHN